MDIINIRRILFSVCFLINIVSIMEVDTAEMNHYKQGKIIFKKEFSSDPQKTGELFHQISGMGIEVDIRPEAFFIDSEGNIYIYEQNGIPEERIQKFDKNGNYLLKFDFNSIIKTFSDAYEISYSGTNSFSIVTMDRNDNFYIRLKLKNRKTKDIGNAVAQFNANGELIDTLVMQKELGIGLLVVDNQKYIWSDNKMNVNIFDSHGSFYNEIKNVEYKYIDNWGDLFAVPIANFMGMFIFNRDGEKKGLLAYSIFSENEKENTPLFFTMQNTSEYLVRENRVIVKEDADNNISATHIWVYEVTRDEKNGTINISLFDKLGLEQSIRKCEKRKSPREEEVWNNIQTYEKIVVDIHGNIYQQAFSDDTFWIMKYSKL